jgi:hypothetical protein
MPLRYCPGSTVTRYPDDNVKYVIWEGKPVCQNTLYLLSSSFNEDMVLLGGKLPRPIAADKEMGALRKG